MKRVPVTSSNVAAVGYDENSNTLEVEFKDGSVYQYFDVPITVHEGFMNAASHGSFLHTEIKGIYRYVKA